MQGSHQLTDDLPVQLYRQHVRRDLRIAEPLAPLIHVVGTEFAHIATSGRVRSTYSDSASSSRHGLISIRAVRSGQSRSAEVLGASSMESRPDSPTARFLGGNGIEVTDTQHSARRERAAGGHSAALVSLA